MAIQVNQQITDGSAVFTIKRKTYSNVGTIEMFGGSSTVSIPVGYLLCDGSAISRTNYSDLFSVIGTTYGVGDGSSTFNLPNFTDKTVWGGGTAGVVKSAGLPNLTGGVNLTYANIGVFVDDPQYGVFTHANQWNNTDDIPIITGISASGAQRYRGLKFNAADCNSIYSDSISTVQPPALTIRFIIKY